MLKRKLHFAARVLALIANSRADSHKIYMESDMYGTVGPTATRPGVALHLEPAESLDLSYVRYIYVI